MRILVTGGAGFIGSNFVRYSRAAHPQDEIVNLDKLTYAGNLENVADLDSDPACRFVRGDITDPEVLEMLVPSVDAIINFAAESHVDRSILSPEEFLQTNVIGTYRLLEAARLHRVERFIQVSTDEVYGSIENGEFSEDDRVRPSSPYSASKGAADGLAHSYWKTYGVPVLITRCSNNFGPYQFPEKLIPLAMANALEGRRIPIYGDGLQARDWLYVTDHCTAIDLVLRNGEPGRIYNVAAGNEWTNLALIERLLNLLGASRSLIEFVKDRPGHDRRYAVRADQIRSLGWAPATSFDSALEGTIAWYRSHRGWWERIRSGEYLKTYEKIYGAAL